jgi:nitrate/TMAO reductase-like tetraheme cytochrome c subunit
MENQNPQTPPSFWKRLGSLRVLFLLGNVSLMVLFFLVIVKDHQREWKNIQADFKKQEIARIEQKFSDANDQDHSLIQEELKSAKRLPIEIRQIWSQEINAIDRCITCHLGHDPLANPSMTTSYQEHPFKAPANSAGFDIHKAHNVEKFGCVVCHGGQGLATNTQAAHGFVTHWEQPLLRGALLQASCLKCHDNIDELNIQNKNFSSEIVRAKVLFNEHGCIGCHQIGGEGGPISVDLREETSKKTVVTN